MTRLNTIALDFASVRLEVAQGTSPVDMVAESCRRVANAAHEGVFVSIVPPGDAIARAKDLCTEARKGRQLPLLGLTFAVKDNIHVVGMVTTSNCQALSISPNESARVILALEEAGAVLVGKNTLDQFATGLNGTRSPEPLCRNAIDPAYIPGGSSSGSAVAVARNMVSFALGSDTGGSGRVPAACNGIVGIKPTVGLVSNRGLLYNSRFFDCVPVFAQTCADAYEILHVIAGYDSADPFSRRDADGTGESTSSTSRRLAVPRADQRCFHGDAASRDTFKANLVILESLGFVLVEIDFAPFAEAGRMVFESAMVAERLVEYGDLVAAYPEAIHPAVRVSIEAGSKYSATDAFRAMYRLKALERVTNNLLAPFDGLVVPTVPTIFTMIEMLADTIALNTVMGTYTYFASPLNLCAASVPGVPRPDGLRSALCFVGLAMADWDVGALAMAFEAAIASLAGVERAR